MRVLSGLVLASAVTGCSTELTPQAQLVRRITLQMTERCQFLGPVSGSEAFGMTTVNDANSALNKTRNEVAARGGNAFVLTQTASTYDGSIGQADAYACPT